jgi:hypothetical protein
VSCQAGPEFAQGASARKRLQYIKHNVWYRQEDRLRSERLREHSDEIRRRNIMVIACMKDLISGTRMIQAANNHIDKISYVNKAPSILHASKWQWDVSAYYTNEL